MERKMTIMTRVVKIFKADIHGVMDQLENQELLLKQHLRDMKEALHQKELNRKRLLAAKKQAQNECSRYRRRSEVLEADLAVAIRKDKDDAARRLIRKVMPINKLLDELNGHIRALEAEITSAGVCLDQQRLQYEQIKHQSAEYFRQTQLGGGADKLPYTDSNGLYAELSEEEVELELLKRKDAIAAA
jgi:phage shock protein A